MSEYLRQECKGGVLRLVLNDPTSRNSLSDAMMSDLQQALDAAGTSPEIRVLVIAGEGPAFCSGHNLKEITARRTDPDRGAAFFSDLFERCARLMLTIVQHPKPVIAEIRGLASAAGCQLVASCDLAIAAQSATFCTPGVNIGLFCSTPMVALSRNVSRKHAMEMLLTGDIIPAAEAERIGLINRAVAESDLSATVLALAKKIVAKSQLTVRTGKSAFYAQADMELESAYAFAAKVMAENLLARDAEEGIAAFIGKRAPKWEDR